MVVTIRQSREPHDTWGTVVVLTLILVSGIAGFWWAGRESRAPNAPVVVTAN
jgi:hypothetical protein